MGTFGPLRSRAGVVLGSEEEERRLGREGGGRFGSLGFYLMAHVFACTAALYFSLIFYTSPQVSSLSAFGSEARSRSRRVEDLLSILSLAFQFRFLIPSKSHIDVKIDTYASLSFGPRRDIPFLWKENASTGSNIKLKKICVRSTSTPGSHK